MAYSQLIKNFQRIRGYMKEFYVYGFKTRDKYNQKSSRSYDNEKRRIESYLGDYMGFNQTPSGKTVFLSIDSRSVSGNPLYKAFKAKSFTDGDITIHFILFDMLHSPEVSLSLNEIADRIDSWYLNHFKSAAVFDISTLRKKLKEYEKLGLIHTQKSGKQLYYQRADDINVSHLTDAITFFSEAGGCGVIGSFLLDKIPDKSSIFSFKHHYITGAPDSEILCALFEAISKRSSVHITYESNKAKHSESIHIIPIKIYVSVQNGRQYVIGLNTRFKKIKSYRLDYIFSVEEGEAADYETAKTLFESIRPHLWGVSMGDGKNTEHVEFTLHIGENEEYIYRRLLREKRIGTVERINKNTARFSADVYDTWEMIPWIRTFICRITALDFSNRTVENQFKRDVEEMYLLYGIGGEE